jgi:tRNA-2-methylthio-N6-dimethylallyladenosine synthase
VLVTGHSRRRDTDLAARTGNNRVVNFPGPARLIGEFVDLRITEALAHTLRGEVVTAEPASAPIADCA